MPDLPPAAAKLYQAEFEALAWAGVPYVGQLGCRVERWAAGDVQIRLPFQPLLQRPGGTICGPALMALADITLYGVVLSVLGRVELAVTTDLTLHFLARPPAADVLATGRLLRISRRLAVGEVAMVTAGKSDLLCHATGSYALPPSVD